MGRTTSAAAGDKLTAGSKNTAGISAGRAEFWQHEIEHDAMPLMLPMS
ncbi:MAG: hypothetical protein WA639_05195 [Candidatus Acidiferrum sp.]